MRDVAFDTILLYTVHVHVPAFMPSHYEVGTDGTCTCTCTQA